MTEQETEAKLKALNKRLARLQAQKHRLEAVTCTRCGAAMVPTS